MTKVNTVSDNQAGGFQDHGGPVILDFGSRTCAPCHAMAPHVELLAETHGECSVYQIDVEDNPDVADRYRIRGIPALLFLSGGEVKSKLLGGQTYAELESWLLKNLAELDDSPSAAP